MILLSIFIALVLFGAPQSSLRACQTLRTTHYYAWAGSATTADGTSVWSGENIVAAPYSYRAGGPNGLFGMHDRLTVNGVPYVVRDWCPGCASAGVDLDVLVHDSYESSLIPDYSTVCW